MTFTQQFLEEAGQILTKIDTQAVDRLVALLAATRGVGGRLFILGVGGSAGNASPAVDDFRKITGIEADAPTDNVSELTARTNDEGWSTVFERWLRVSRLRSDDMLLIFSVGGGNLEKQVSPNLVEALKYARLVGAKIGGIVGRDGGYTAQVAGALGRISLVNAAPLSPRSEALQAIVWHLLVSHPDLKQEQTKWESVV